MKLLAAFVKLLLAIALFVYIFFIATRLAAEKDPTTCQTLYVEIADSARAGFITRQEVENILRQKNVYPIGVQMDDINVAEIAGALKTNRFVDSVLCYTSPRGCVNICLSQRLPLLRVISDSGQDFYLDAHGKRLPPSGYCANLLVATGHLPTQREAARLIPLAQALADDEVLDAQFEQIDIDAHGDATLVPRVGRHLVRFGSPDSIQVKLRNLRVAYRQILPAAGWDKYREINVKYPSQIICRKK